MKARLSIIAAFLLSSSVLGLFAYTITPWSYEDLFAKSDFVAIGSPLTAPHDTTERITLPNVSPPTPAIGVTTEFKTLFTLKGPKHARFKLHHYRLADLKPSVVLLDGPGLVTFEPPKKRNGVLEEAKRYLLFLVTESDGRFAPVNSQSDPDGISVQEVSGVTFDD
jgi:hypothetical protein